jgi:hypothetical protein
MKKVILTVATVLIAGLSNAQWTSKTVNNGFDDVYKICYTAYNNNAILKLERLESGHVLFYIQGGYYCDENPTVDLSFLVENKWVKYTIKGTTGSKKDAVYFDEDLEIAEFSESFLWCSSLKVRINETYCDTEIYQFNMSGSTNAFNFIKK